MKNSHVSVDMALVLSLTVVVLIFVQVGAAVVRYLRQGKACMTRRKDN